MGRLAVTSHAEEFRSSFESLGYTASRGVSSAPQDRWYRFASSTEQAIHVANLQYKPTAKAYGVRLGVYNPEAQALVRGALPLILRYLHPAFATDPSKYFSRPHWILFDVGRALQWSLLAIPNPLARDEWSAQLRALRERYLEPIFWKVRTVDELIELALRNDTPFEWSVSGPVLRTAEVVALSKVANRDSDDVGSRLLAFTQTVQAGMYGSDDFALMVEQFGAAMQR